MDYSEATERISRKFKKSGNEIDRQKVEGKLRGSSRSSASSLPRRNAASQTNWQKNSTSSPQALRGRPERAAQPGKK